MARRTQFLLSTIFAGLTLTACGASDDNAATASAQSACEGDGVTVNEAWARSSRAGQPTSAAYMSLCSAEGDTLVSASFSGANATELHVTVTGEDGTASMSQTPEITLPAGELVALEPGGAHIMMIGLDAALAPGDAAAITLEFEKAGAVEIDLDVRDAMGAGHH